MRTPGFTATAPLGQTRRGDAARKGLTVDTENSVVPAQSDSPTERIEQLVQWKSRGEPKWLWSDRPRCPLGQQAVWVSRGPTAQCCDTVRRVWDKDLMQYVYVPVHVCDWQQCGGFEPAFTGWECQDIRLRVVT